MNVYAIWVDLAPGAKDLEFVAAVNAYLEFLRPHGVHSWRITRRKFGFGPPELGEFYIQIESENLADLDAAFDVATTREPEVEALHRAVYSRVTNYRSGLYRDFPDANRVQG